MKVAKVQYKVGDQRQQKVANYPSKTGEQNYVSAVFYAYLKAKLVADKTR